MLMQLHIRQFVIVEKLTVDFQSGMTAITGETGAGKSISLDALSLCLGARAEASMVRAGAAKAEITASFDLTNMSAAADWLKAHDLDADNECIIRRTLTAEGRSKAYINGAPVPLASLKALGPLLVNIHGQHEHQQLTRMDHQLAIVDQFGDHQSLLSKVRSAWQEWQKLSREQRQLAEQLEHQQARKQLLSYQVSELKNFALSADEFPQLEQDHKRLANASSLRDEAAFSLNTLYDGEHNNAFSLLQAVIERLGAQQSLDSQLEPVVTMLNEASVQVEEAVRELRHYHDAIDIEPEQLQEVEQRMTTALQLAKKHQISAEQLPQLQADLEQELEAISLASDRVDGLSAAIEAAEQEYLAVANQLADQRASAAAELGEQISASMQQLNMEQGQFAVQVDRHPERPSATGIDSLEFYVSANPGQPLQPLHKVASGGELSRISLAIQVIAAKHSETPTLMFDEVDVGVSGPTAATVGKLLRQLGERNQVICVTHLPQVAAKAQHQLCVRKHHENGQTHTTMVPLAKDDRVIELARLLGGDSITDKTKANAQELLAS